MAERQTILRWAASARRREPLDLDLMADFSFAEPDHVALVEYKQDDIVEKAWIILECEVQFLGRGHHDVALADRILVEAADTDAPIERGDGLPERTKGALQGRFRLGRKGSQRCHEDDRRPAARHRRMHSSEMRVLPALIGRETTRSSAWSTARAAAAICEGHRSISAFGRRISEAMKSSRNDDQSAESPLAGSNGRRSWNVESQRSNNK
jgi:hypothetical protein